MSRQQPGWNAPAATTSTSLPAITVFNSLTRSKTPFVPIDPAGKKVTWYACGPTVYDDAHLGHARNYVSTDIIRRILQDYFRFDVNFVMNITDVDDKIILRGRQQYLLAKFRLDHSTLDKTLIETANTALGEYVESKLPLLAGSLSLGPSKYDDEAKKAYGSVLSGKALSGTGPAGDKEAKLKMHLRTISTASKAVAAAQTKADSLSVDEFYAQTEDVLLPYLDRLHHASIDGSDHSIFTKLTSKYEKRFFDDVGALNVRMPDVITRVTEYGDQVVQFVKQVVDNGFAYPTTDGSVYFDIAAFEKAGNPYARLEPWNRNDQALRDDGEGALAARTAEKRSDADFAVWKASKAGEPAWVSPWGPGRPGWHIECSAMASDILGHRMDIHSGGIDLAFPHHDNELALSEARWAKKTASTGSDGGTCCPDSQWVNYFLHMGHLSIQGAKMSKSLKNFTTIREVLERGDWTPRALRIVFLLGGWKEGIEITDDLIRAGQSWEERVSNLFIRLLDGLRQGPANTDSSTAAASQLAASLETAKTAIHTALCDSFNTPAAMQAISDLVGDANIALSSVSDIPSAAVSVADFVTEMVTVFGLNPNGEPGSADNKTDKSRFGWAGVDLPPNSEQFVYPLSRLRDKIRSSARAGTISAAIVIDLVSDARATLACSSGGPENKFAIALAEFADTLSTLTESDSKPSEFLAVCDQLRDGKLWDLGVYLEDTDSGTARIRPLQPSDLIARETKSKIASDQAIAKAKRIADEKARQDQIREKAKVSPTVMFRTSDWTEWDSDGIPIKDKDGKEVSKARMKKMKKEWERQKELHERWVNGSK